MNYDWRDLATFKNAVVATAGFYTAIILFSADPALLQDTASLWKALAWCFKTQDYQQKEGRKEFYE